MKYTVTGGVSYTFVPGDGYRGTEENEMYNNQLRKVKSQKPYHINKYLDIFIYFPIQIQILCIHSKIFEN